MTPSTLARLGIIIALVASFAGVNAEGVSKSPADTRDYATFVLDNRMRVLIVSDPGTDKAAAALDVNVGNGSDPKTRGGLAHFLEHMLFLGTEKYPDPGEYHQFISEHGGSNNAYTSFDHTNYFFGVDSAFLEPSLDRFAQFFIAPRFDPAYVDRERQVVHSEYASKQRSDGLRLHQAFKEAINPDHPMSRFLAGNAESLAQREGSDLRAELIEFYQRHYSANLMTLVVLGREPLATLEGWVREKFSAVADRRATRLEITEPLFSAGRLPARLDVKPVRDIRSISLSFPVPSMHEHFRSKPQALVSHLIGHEGPGSLLSVLKERGLADELSAGLGLEHPDFATYSISIKATPEGLANVETIAGLVFDAIEQVAADGLEAWRYDELATMAGIEFRYVEKGDPIRYASALASALHRFPAEDVLRAGSLYERFDPELMNRFISRLRPDNMLLTVTGPDAKTDRVARYYGAEYALRPIAPETIATLASAGADPALRLPTPNPFIPESLALRDGDGATDRPVRIHQAPGLELWHRQDTEFRQPRADFFVAIRSPLANESARGSLLTVLFTRLVNDELNAFAYPAYLAGQSYRLYKQMRGISIRLSGWSDRQTLLLERILGVLVAPQLSAERFDIIKADLLRELRNDEQRVPYRRAASELHELLIVPNRSEAELIEALEPLELADLRAFVPELMGRVRVVALAHGNLRPEDARALAGALETHLAGRLAPIEVEHARVLKLGPGERKVRTIRSRHADHAALVYFQGATRELEDRALAALLSQVVSSAFFDRLRTEEKLGYIVYSTLMTLLEAPGIGFVVQSPTATPATIVERIHAFLTAFGASIETMSAEELDRHRAALLSELLQAETQLTERTDRYWTELDREQYRFDLREQLADAVRVITPSTFSKFYRGAIANPATLRQLAVLVENQSDQLPTPPAGFEPLTSKSEFAAGRAFFD